MFGRLWVDLERCGNWLDNIFQYRQEWDDDKKMFGEKPLHDFTSHCADVHRYASIIEDLMTNEEKPKKQVKQINRGKFRAT